MHWRDLDRLLLTLWLGSWWSIGYLVVPVIFAFLPDKQVAGNLGGELFRSGAWLAASACVLLLLLSVCTGSGRGEAGRGLHGRTLWHITLLVQLMLTLLGLLYLQPHMASMKQEVLPLPVMESALRERFSLWHGISSLLYLLQSLLGGWMLWIFGRLDRPRERR